MKRPDAGLQCEHPEPWMAGNFRDNLGSYTVPGPPKNSRLAQSSVGMPVGGCFTVYMDVGRPSLHTNGTIA